ncbi:hypothetical protein EHM76_04420 [bacterium]|nr:MAG: hypothetical protein EHM76_04420 [bacterium]
MKEDIKKAAERWKKLMAMANDAGASEAEVMKAMEAARKIKDEYQLSMTDAELEAEGTSQEKTFEHKASSEIVNRKLKVKLYLHVAVAAFCECKSWQFIALDKDNNQIVFFGMKSDTLFASWLLDTLAVFVQRECDRYLTKEAITGSDPRWKARVSFTLACTTRINKRLENLVKERNKQKIMTKSGHELIVVKNAIVERNFGKLKLELEDVRGRARQIANRPAYDAGKEAGDRARFDRPINQGEPVKQLTE